MKSFTIEVFRSKGAYSACAFGVQGNWSMGLNSALEDLLNKLLQAGIEHLAVICEHPEKTPFDAPGPNPARIASAREDETETGQEAS